MAWHDWARLRIEAAERRSALGRRDGADAEGEGVTGFMKRRDAANAPAGRLSGRGDTRACFAGHRDVAAKRGAAW
ncbi:hypothetical protein [Streptomyces sp. NPDC050560]|uniref:hypothetical protein n=1 Tax=Streptomyces sp. NPDC050560 TaxID=3365630 RepID=UPI0037AE8A5A